MSDDDDNEHYASFPLAVIVLMLAAIIAIIALNLSGCATGHTVNDVLLNEGKRLLTVENLP